MSKSSKYMEEKPMDKGAVSSGAERFKQMDLEEEIARMRIRDNRLDDRGREVVDDTPMAPPIGYFKQPSMIDHIRNLVRSERLRQEVEAQGLETLEEADDFEVGDDYDPSSPYEYNFDPPLPPAPEKGGDGPGAGAGGSPIASPDPAPQALSEAKHSTST